MSDLQSQNSEPAAKKHANLLKKTEGTVHLEHNSPLGNDEGIPEGKLGAPGILGVAKATTGVARGMFEVLRLTCVCKRLDMHTYGDSASD